MTTNELIEAIRKAQSVGKPEIAATLREPRRGCKAIALRNISGARNGNLHDVWVESASGKKTLGRIYLGSKNTPANTEGWESFIESIG